MLCHNTFIILLIEEYIHVYCCTHFVIVSSPDFNPPMEEDDSSSLDRIKSLLQSVGASLGSSSNTHQRRSMSHRRGGERHMPGSSHMPDSSHMQHVMKTETEVSNFKKINTVYYKEVHEKFREWICHSPMPHPMKAGEAENLLRMMAEAEEYRKKCGSRILVLDGGGMRGLIQLTVLEEIERLMGKRIVELFDWIIGTSTGGIIALALTYGKIKRTGMFLNETSFIAVRQRFK